MYGREYFHETVVRDIVDVLTSLKDYDEVEFLNNSSARRSFKSITSATKDLILTFPVMVSSDVDIDTATMFAKAHEKKCASLMHMLFLAICVGDNEDIYDFVKKFHTNTGSLTGSFDDYDKTIDDIANLVDEGATYKIDKVVLERVMEDLRESNYTLPDDISEVGLNEYQVIPGSAIRGKDTVVCVHEAKGGKKGGKQNRGGGSGSGGSGGSGGSHGGGSGRGGSHGGGNGNNNGGGGGRNNTTNVIRIGGGSSITSGVNKDLADYLYRMNDMTRNQVFDNDYKKANELQPTMMVVNFNKKGDTSNEILTCVIGIKCKIYSVAANDICDRLSNKLADNKVLTNFIRATTNEIGFFRDFLFAIDRAKLDALSYGKSNKSNKLWKVLERRSIKSRFRRSLKMYNDATAITTLLLSQNDADYLLKEKMINIENVQVCRKLFDKFNLMCIAIANDATEVLSLIYDTGEDNFEKVSYSGLEREASDGGYKKMVNLLTKMNR